MIYTNFEFHSVGHGLFYTAEIKKDGGKSYNFVFDCGTLNSRAILGLEIDNYKKRINSKLDLLIISHFDIDHVNGVEQLLKGIKLKRLIIPFYTPFDRLAIISHAPKNISEAYFLLLQNPYKYFSSDRFDIDEIVVIQNEDDNISDYIPTPFNDIANNIDTPFIDSKKKFGVYTSLEEELLNKKDSDKIKLASLPFTTLINDFFWEFSFYHKSFRDSSLYKQFRNELDEIKSVNKLKNDYELLQKKYIKEIKHAYKKLGIGSNLNPFSMIVYHGKALLKSKSKLRVYEELRESHIYPICPYILEIVNSIALCSNCRLFNIQNNSCGTLLTGDSDFNNEKEVKNILLFFSKYLDRVCIFQVPHHGSKGYWNEKPEQRLKNFNYYIISNAESSITNSQFVEDWIISSCGIDKLIKVTQKKNYICNAWFLGV